MERPYAVVIGASAGGVQALMELAGGLPAGFPATVLVVQHIGAHPSVLPELLASRGPNPARHAADGDLPQPGTIHVAPPDCHMVLEADRIRLVRGPKENHARPAIDPLFRSAACYWGAQTIGVLLSGQLDDGTAGMQAVKACGGFTIVQDPSTATEPEMPRNALNNVAIDLCLPVGEIAAALVSRVAGVSVAGPAAAPAPELVAREVRINQGIDVMDNLLQLGKASGLTCPDCGGSLFELTDARPVRYRCHTGHAYSPRSLEHAQGETVEAALWSSARALQEKEMLLRRLAAVARSSGRSAEAEVGERRADEVREQALKLTRMIEDGAERSA